LPKLEFVQFPWRVLFVVTTAMTVLLVAVLSRWSKRVALVFLILLALVGALPSGWHATWHSNAVRDVQDEIAEKGGYEPDDAFLPGFVDTAWLAANRSAPPVALTSLDGGPAQARVTVDSWGPDRKRFTIDAEEPVVATLRLLDYPGWRVTSNSRHIKSTTHNRAGLITIPISAGHSQVEVAFRRTPDRVAGDLLSLVGVIAWVAVLASPRRRTSG
jgi:hypothetical protein